MEIHGHVVTIVRVAPHPFTLHHLSPPFNHFRMQSLVCDDKDALGGCIHFTCCCLLRRCNGWEIGVTEVYDTFMMSCGVGLLGHWQQRNCYSRVFSDTLGPQLGFHGVVQNIAHVPAAVLMLVSSLPNHLT